MLRKICLLKRRFKVSLNKEDTRNNCIMRSFVIFTPTNIRKAIQLRNMRYKEWVSSDRLFNCLVFYGNQVILRQDKESTSYTIEDNYWKNKK